MTLGFILLVTGAIVGPIAWRYSGSPASTRRWTIAAFIGIGAIVPMRLVQAGWPVDSGENYGSLVLLLLGAPMAATAAATLAVCAIRSRQRNDATATVVAAIGIGLCAALVLPPFLR